MRRSIRAMARVPLAIVSAVGVRPVSSDRRIDCSVSPKISSGLRRSCETIASISSRARKARFIAR